MDVTAVTQLIGTVGFPIVMCAAMFWKMNEQDKQHKQEMDKMSEAINNNTLAITKLVDHLDSDR